ncbi:MAG: hypothetical protein AB7G23_17730 [Vicinamibacterales bacterium]
MSRPVSSVAMTRALLLAVLLTAAAPFAPPLVVPAQAQEAVEHAEEAEHAEEGPHEETIWGPISRLFNSAVLIGVLFYFLRGPAAAHLGGRSAEIRADLVNAARMKQEATAQLAQLEQKMAALPAELEALKQHGQQEILAEEARIEQAAVAERERLLDQARREIDLQLRVAQRDLVEHASNLAVGLATERIRRGITPADQDRLVDRYLTQVKP